MNCVSDLKARKALEFLGALIESRGNMGTNVLSKSGCHQPEHKHRKKNAMNQGQIR